MTAVISASVSVRVRGGSGISASFQLIISSQSVASKLRLDTLKILTVLLSADCLLA